jgi:hypothetical protein
MDHAFIQGGNSGGLDVRGSIEIRPADLKMNYPLSLFFQASGLFENLSDTGKWYIGHTFGCHWYRH